MSSSLPDAIGDGVEAFVLAGGNSSRMGQDKALVHLAGVPLLQRAIDTLRAAGLNPRIAGACSDLESFAPIIPDDPSQPGLGPLSGICSALSATRARYAIFLSVDLPFVPPGLISYLLYHARITESVITLASLAGFVQTFPVVIDRTAAPALQASLRSGDRKCTSAFHQAAASLRGTLSVLPIELLVQPAQISHTASLPASTWFRNINSPGDLVRAESLLPIRSAANFS